jgi:hypothetical protein
MGAVVGENLKRNQSFYQKQNPIYNDFKIRWSKNDGSGLFFDALAKHL